MPIVSGGIVFFWPAAVLVETGIILFMGGLLTIRVWQSRRCVVSENQASHPIYIKVKGRWAYLYRAVDSLGRTVDFYLSGKRDVNAAKHFFRQAMKSAGTPRVITLDAYAASHRAVRELKAEGRLPQQVRVRSSKFLNNRVEMV